MKDILAIALAGVAIYLLCRVWERWDERRAAREELDRLHAQHMVGATDGDDSP